MQTVHLNINDPTVKQIVSAAFPGYDGRRVAAHVCGQIEFWGTQWDDGNRRTYVAVRLADMATFPAQRAPYMHRSPAHEKLHDIPEGFVVAVFVESGNYQHIEIVAPPATVTPLLPAPIELTDDERIFLCACSIKNTYAGESNHRFHEAARRYGMTSDRWETARASLLEKKFITRAGAITDEGRNARGTSTYHF